MRLVLGDARNELRRGDERYALIISEPSNPWLTGVANLFTLDFFRIAASRLDEDGILCQWFHLYGMSEESTRSLVATFREVFPEVVAFKDRDLILLGSLMASRVRRRSPAVTRSMAARPTSAATKSRRSLHPTTT